MREFDTLQLVQPSLLEEALRASGVQVGNRIPGCRILYDALGKYGLSLHYSYETMTLLQKLATELHTDAMASGLRNHVYGISNQLSLGDSAYRSTGGLGPCRCLICRIRLMRLEDIGEALSEY